MAKQSALASSGFPGSILEPFLNTVNSFGKSGVEKATDAFGKYLNGDDNKTIRLFAAEADGIVQQASTVLLLRRLAAAADANLPGYAYAGTVEVAYAGGEATLEKLQDLLPELKGGKEGKVGEATVKLVEFPFAEAPSEVNLGLTGGAPKQETEIDFPKELKVKYFLRLQPYRQEGPEQVQVGGEKPRTIELTEQESLGKEKFALRAWAVAEPVVSADDWSYYTGDTVPADVKRNAEILQWLTESAQTADFDLQPLTGIDAYLDGGTLVTCPMGSPAGERVFQVVAGALATQVDAAGKPVDGRSPVIVLNFSRYDPKASTSLSFDPYLEGLLAGKPTESEVAFLPESLGGTADGLGVASVVRAYQSRKAYLEGVDAGKRVTFLDKPTLDEVKTKANAIRNKPDQALFLQLGPVPQPLFDFAYSKNGLPSVMTGFDNANLGLTLDRFYFNVSPPDDSEILYPETVLTKNGNGAVPFAIQTVANAIGAGLSDWPAKDSENPAVVQGSFVKSWRSGDAVGVQFKAYVKRVAAFYRKKDNDKLNLGLSYLNYVIETPADNPLPDLFKKLKEGVNEETKQLNIVPNVFPVTSVIGDFFSKLLAGYTDGKLVMTVSKLEAEPDEENPEKILLSGETDVFGLTTGLDIEYTAPDNRVVSNNKFTAKTSWSIPGVEWIVFADPFVEADVSDAKLPSVGAVGGTVRGGDQGPSFTFRFQAPVQDDKWLLQGTFGEPLPSIETFYQLAGGVNITASLPPPLNILSNLSLKDFELLYDQGNTQENRPAKAEYLNFSMATTQKLKLLPTLDLYNLGLQFNIQNPKDVATRKWTTTVGADFGFLPPSDGVVAVSAKFPAMVFSGNLKSGEITLPSLLRTFIPVIPPDSLDFLQGVRMTAFSFSYQKEKEALDVSTQLNTNFKVIDVIQFDQLTFQISRKRADNAVLNTGSVVGQTTILPGTKQAFGVAVSAEYKGEKEGWTFETHTTSPVLVAEMMKVYLKWDIGDFDLAIETLSFRYEQKNGSWEFNGATNVFKLPPPINSIALQVSAQLGDNKGSENVAKGFIGPGCYGCPEQRVQSRFIPELPPLDEKPKGKYGFVNGKFIWERIELDFSYNFGPKPEDAKICLGLKLGAFTFKACLETRNGDEVAAFKLPGQTLGSMVEEFVGWVRGGQKFNLPAPWSVLNSVPLDKFELIYNFTKKTVQFGLNIGPIELGFATIKGIGLEYSKNADTGKYEAVITLDGSFFWLKGTEADTDKLSWNAADPNDTKTPPGQGSKYLDLRLLAMGQHVTVEGLRTVNKVQEAIDLMKKLPETDPCKVPPVVFLPESEWIFGTDFGVLRLEKENGGGGGGGQSLAPLGESAMVLADGEGAGYFLTLQVIFNDPILYALRIALDGKPAKIFKGLDFQIMYVQVSDTVGKYQAEITLPDIMRRITAGAYTIILPVFGIAIFTNGDFQVDVGFPWNQDFSRSFTIEAIVYPGIPVLGSAGFYFGKLSSETTNKVPAVTDGTFNPVIVFGFGAQLGLGKSIEAGILKAGFSVTAFGIIEGVIAKWNPYDGDVGTSSNTQIQGQYYFWLQGTFGLIGKLYGSIDFAIIKADVNVGIQLYVQITFASYEPIPITAVAQVDVEVKVTINLGLFKIKISFSFHMKLKVTFTIANSGTPPWTLANGQQRAFIDMPRHRLSDVRRAEAPELFALAEIINWDNLQAPAIKLALKGWLANALTAAGDEAKTTAEQLACYVAVMSIEAPKPSNEDAVSGRLRAAGEAPDTSFEALAKQVFRWAAAAVLGPMTPEDVDSKPIMQTQLQAVLDSLSDPTVAEPIPPADVETFLSRQTVFTVQKPPTEAGEVNAAYFPVPSPLKLTVPKYGDNYPGYSYTFGDYNTAPEKYLQLLRKFFDELAVKVRQEMCLPSEEADFSTEGGTSIGSYIEMDYFVLLARQMVQAGLDGLRDYQYPIQAGQSSDDVIAWVTAENGLVEYEQDGKVETRPFELGDLFAGNPEHPLSGGKSMTVDGVRYQVQPGDSFDSIAAQSVWGGSFTGKQLATANGPATQILREGAKVTFAGSDHIVQPTDTLDSIAAGYGVDLSTLLEQSNVLTSTELLASMGLLALPPVIYPTAADNTDTLSSVAARFGVQVAQLATSANGGVTDLFFSDGQTPTMIYLDLVHLAQLNVGALIADAQRTPAIQHASGMASRYYLHGLRLPTRLEEDEQVYKIEPKHPGMWVKDENGTLTLPEVAGLFALSGQQFPLPDITAENGAFTITLDKTAGPSWLQFEGGGDQWSIPVTPDGTDNAAIKAVLNYARANRLATGLKQLGVGDLSQLRDASYAMASALTWQAAGSVPLPYGAPSGVESLRLWRLPDPLTALPDPKTRAVNPRLKVEIARYDEATGIRTATPAPYYGWASTVSFSIKKLPESARSGPASATTYEIVGAADKDIVLMERLLAEVGNDDAAIFSLLVGYPPDGSGKTPQGVQTDELSALTFGIAQVNLSTVTRPPGGGAAAAAETDEAEGPNLLNTGPMEFVRLLWEASITRAGGFYLYYRDEARDGGLPERIFNDRGEAPLTLILLYAMPAESADQNRAADYMNALATGFGVADDSVVTAVADPVLVKVASDANQTLAGLARLYFADIGQLAADNSTLKLRQGKTLSIRGGVYEVPAAGVEPGGDPAAIAAYFNTTVDALKKANPKLNLDQTLALWTAVRLPDLPVVVGTDPGGDTLGDLASYYSVAVESLGSDNRGIQGLFADGQQVAVAGGPVVRNATVGAGVEPVAAARPAVVGDPDPASDPKGFLQANFSLLGYRVAGNVSFDGKTAFSLPAGPTTPRDDAAGAERTAVPRQLTADDLWRYDNAVPFPGFALPLEADPSPYHGVGAMLQLDFSWQDLYGNLLITDLSNPQAGDGEPLNQPPLLLGYTDPIIGLAGWPSVTGGWNLAAGPKLRVETAFSPASYKPENNNLQPDAMYLAVCDETPAWQKNAELDLGVVDNLLAQLNDPLGVRYTVTSSLLPETALTLDSTKVQHLLNWLGAVQAFLADRAKGGQSVPPPGRLGLEFDIDPQAVNQNQIYELQLEFTIERTGGLASGDFAASQGVLAATTKINPGDPSPQSSPQDAILTLREFAADFEKYLSTADVLWKIAGGVDRREVSSSNRGGPVWAVRLGLGAGQGISYEVKAVDEALVFAPRPIATELINRSAEIHPYSTGKGIEQSSQSKRFVGVDMDNWGRQFFGGIDGVLVPEFTAPMQILQQKIPNPYKPKHCDDPSLPADPGYLAAALCLKKRLADLVKDWMVKVFDEENPSDEQLAAIRETFKQQLLVRLSDAYTTRAGVEFLADVVADVTDPVAEFNPRLYGDLTQIQKSGNLEKSTVTFTAPKLELKTTTGTEPGILPFLISSPSLVKLDGAVVPSINLELAYSGSAIEHQIGKVPGIEDYQASTWLSFVDDKENPLRRDLNPGRPLAVPLVMRSYPATPEMAAQSGEATFSPEQSGSDLDKLLRWTYAFTYSLPYHYPQDTVQSKVAFNIRDDETAALLDFKDAFEDLAEFITEFPKVQRDLNNYLSKIDTSTSPDSDEAKNASVALVAFLQMVDDVTGAAAGSGLTAANLALAVTELETYEFRINEGVHSILQPEQCDPNPDREPIQALTVMITDVSGVPGTLKKPVVQVGDNTYQPVEISCAQTPFGDATYCYLYQDPKTKCYLTAAEGQAVADRTVVLEGIDILARQDAWASVYIERNANLVEKKTVTDDFIYKTPEVRFANPFHPTIDDSTKIDISTIPAAETATVGADEHFERSLDAHLTALFDSLLKNVAETELSVQTATDYIFSINAALDGVPQPVVFQPPTLVEKGEGTGTGALPLAQMIADLSASIRDAWFSQNRPSPSQGVLSFDVLLMTTLTENPLPLVRLRNLELPTRYIQPPLPSSS